MPKRLPRLSLLSDSEIWRVVIANDRFIGMKARPIARRTGLDINDLMQEGRLGFFHGVELFDVAKRFNLRTYAGRWVDHMLGAFVDRARTTIHVTHRVIVRAAKTELAGLTVTRALSPVQKRMVAQAKAALSIGGLGAGDVLVAGESTARDRSEVNQALDGALDRLPALEATVLRQQFGYDGPATKPRQLERQVGQNRVVVRRIADRALEMLLRDAATNRWAEGG